MPVYEYCCSGCDLKFELLRPMSQMDQDAPCPKCKNGAHKVLSVFAAFSKSSGGDSVPVAGGGGCDGCTASTCSSCH